MKSEVIIRKYANSDCGTVSELFYDTVHAVNAEDYSCEQLFAWAANPDCLKSRGCDLLRQYTLIAEIGGKTVGFGSIDKTGCLDLLFVHKDFLRQGIATALCDGLEKGFPILRTYASITAKPFFEKRGYRTVKENEVERKGVKLKNYEMKKNAFEIRCVGLEDKEGWSALDGHLSESEFGRKVRDRQGFVLIKDGKTIGILRYNLFWDEVPFCTLLYIAEEYRSKGFGKSMMEFWEREMLSLGYGRLLVSTRSDEDAQHFYRAVGYGDCGSLTVPNQPEELLLSKQIF